MKKITLAVVVMSVVLTTQAQNIPERNADKPPMMERHKGHHGHDGVNMKELNLTDAQKEQFKAKREEFKKKMEDLKKNDGITVKEWKAKAEALRKEQKASIDGILTPEQKAKMEKMKADHKAKGEEMMKQRSEKMKTQLGLSDEQSAKLDKNRKEMGEKMKAIRENKSLSDDQKREQMKELMKSQKENMKSILTEEQLKKMKEMRDRNGGHGHKPAESAPKEENKSTL